MFHLAQYKQDKQTNRADFNVGYILLIFILPSTNFTNRYSVRSTVNRLTGYSLTTLVNLYIIVYHIHLGIESHFVDVHGPYELHRKEQQIKCTVLAVHENLLFFLMQFIWPVNTDKMRFNTYIYIF